LNFSENPGKGMRVKVGVGEGVSVGTKVGVLVLVLVGVEVGVEVAAAVGSKVGVAVGSAVDCVAQPAKRTAVKKIKIRRWNFIYSRKLENFLSKE